MTEVQNVVPEDGFNIFDPDNAVVSSRLNGRRGTIVKIEARRHNYNGKIQEEVTGVFITVISRDLEKPVELIIGAGALYPSRDAETFKKGQPDSYGDFLVGGKLSKQANLYDFLNEAKSAGFDVSSAATKGLKAYLFADFTWKAVEKGRGKFAKAYDFPAEYHGVDAEGQQLLDQYNEAQAAAKASGSGDAQGEAAAPSEANAAPAPSAEESKAIVTTAVLAALAKAPNKELSRGLLSVKTSPELPAGTNPKVLAVLVQESFLSSIPGTTFDKKTLKLVG